MPGSPDRRPGRVDRPPVSRVGDELAAIAADESLPDDVDPEEMEALAVTRARRKGWDHDLDDVHPPDADLGRGAD